MDRTVWNIIPGNTCLVKDQNIENINRARNNVLNLPMLHRETTIKRYNKNSSIPNEKGFLDKN